MLSSLFKCSPPLKKKKMERQKSTFPIEPKAKCLLSYFSPFPQRVHIPPGIPRSPNRNNEKNLLQSALFPPVSHTTHDLVFIWDPTMPLDVDKGIELPQLELISTKNDDCTTEYSTGKKMYKIEMVDLSRALKMSTYVSLSPLAGSVYNSV